MLPQKEAVIMVTLRVSASSDPQRSSQRRSLGNASCPRSGANSTDGAMNRTAQRTRLCSQANPQARAWWPECWDLGSEVPPSWRYLAFWLTPPLLQGLRRLGWAEGHPFMDLGGGGSSSGQGFWGRATSQNPAGSPAQSRAASPAAVPVTWLESLVGGLQEIILC